jgi:hypothetical protein
VKNDWKDFGALVLVATIAAAVECLARELTTKQVRKPKSK